jgi:hypothetical protein
MINKMEKHYSINFYNIPEEYINILNDRIIKLKYAKKWEVKTDLENITTVESMDILWNEVCEELELIRQALNLKEGIRLSIKGIENDLYFHNYQFNGSKLIKI